MIAAFLLAGVVLAQDTARLTLTQVVDRALAAHPSVGVAHALRDRAAADVQEARATRMPRLSFEAGVNRFQEPMVVAPLHGFDPAHPPLFDRTLVQSGLTLNWIAYDFGSRAGYVRAQRLLEDAARTGITVAESDLIARAATAYLAVLGSREVLAAQDQRLAALGAESRRVRQLLAEGKAARLSALRIDAESRRAEADRIVAASRRNAAETELAQLAGLSQAAIRGAVLARVELADTSRGDTSSAHRAALLARAGTSNATVRQLEERARAARAGLGAIRRTAWPELRLAGGYVDRGRWFGDYAAEWQMGLSVSYAIYGGGTRESGMHRASADERAAMEQVRLARMSVESAIIRALSAIEEARARVEALRSAVEQSEEVTRIERLALDVGTGTQSDFLESQANLLGARASLIEARHAEMLARVELARILGELSREWLTRNLERVP